MTFEEYMAAYDDSHLYVTARDSVWFMATLAKHLGAQSVLELGSFQGHSAIAFGLACPTALITAVDLADVLPASFRKNRYASFGLNNVIDVTADAGSYIKMFSPRSVDVVFHDACHGPAVVPEYAAAWQITRKLLVIHDWELTKDGGQQLLAQTIAPESKSIYWHRDQKTRVTLFAQRAT